jgi:tRNA dimethylallyltransferase
MKQIFFIVGPTATGKSELAAEVAVGLGAEIVSADAFQIYQGLDLLTAKPDGAIQAKAPHHLIGTVPLTEEMNVEKYRTAADEVIRDIQRRGKVAIVTGGSGLYVKALTHGLAKLPAADPKLREELDRLESDELHARLCALDPQTGEQIDGKNKRRLVRALEVCLLSGKPFSAQRMEWNAEAASGAFVFRERAELYSRIDCRVEQMFEAGVVEEVRSLGQVGATADKTLGLREIRGLLRGDVTRAECIAKIQQATRRYAKRQLTWFQRQNNFEPLNLSPHGFSEAIDLIAQNARRVCANG